MKTRNFVIATLFTCISTVNLVAQCNNLLENGNANGGLTGWTFSTGSGQTWEIQANSFGDAFTSSHMWSTMEQTIDLIGNGYTAQFLDDEPRVSFSQMFKGRYTFTGDSNDQYYFHIELLDGSYSIIDSIYFGSQSSPIITTTSWDTINDYLADYGPGLRHIRVECGGNDAENWAGHWGVIIDNTVVSISDVSDTTICFGDTVYFNGDTLWEAGTYYAEYSGVYGCDSITELRITVDTVIAVTFVDSNISCNGLANGGVSAINIVGSGSNSYYWNTGSVDSSLTGLSAGTYSVTVSSINGCTDSASVSVFEPLEISATVYNTPVISGYTKVGETDSSFVYFHTDSLSWDDAWQSALAAGGDLLVIKDSIHQNYYTSLITGHSWIGLRDVETEGEYVWVDGTIATYFDWETGEPNNFGGNEDHVQFHASQKWNDYNGNIPTAFGMVIYKSTLNPSNVSCFGGNDGIATINAAGGTEPYTYTWSSGSNNDSITGLSAGVYYCTVTDFNGCTDVDTAIVSEPKELMFHIDTIGILCAGDSTGIASVSVNPLSGTPPYSYNWNTGDTTDSITEIPAGSYTVTVSDANGCSETASITLNNPPEISLNLVLDSNVSCNGLSDGGASGISTGGTGTISYYWNTGSIDSSIFNLSAGMYSLTIEDQAGCTDTSSIYIDEPDSLIVYTNLDTSATCYNANDGVISAFSIGGTMPYSYQWNNLAIDSQLTGLPIGLYEVTMTDANGCTDSASIFLDYFDTIDPTPVVQSTTIYLDSNGFAILSVLDIDNGSFDNCGLDTMFLDQTVFDCSSLGIDTVEFTVIDSNFNAVAVNVGINVLDTIAPIIQCPSDTTNCVDILNFSPPTGLDNCSSFSITQISGLPSGSTYPMGSTLNTFVITDSSGNQATCSFTVTRDTLPSQAEAGTDIELCVLNTTTLSAVLPDVGIGSWHSLGSALVQNELQHNTNISDLSLGENLFVWTVTNGMCPPNTDTVIVRVDDLPSTANAGIDVELCDQFSYELDANIPELGTGYWTVQNQGIISDTLSATSTVSFPVGKSIFTWNIKNGVCPISSDDVGIFAGESPLLDVGPDINLLGKAKVSVSAEINHPAMVRWEPASLVDDFESLTTFANIEETSELVVTATSDPFCVSTDTLVIRVLKPVEINTIFTPNSDGINDFWDIEGSDNYPQIKVFVFNRWGAQVFESDEGYTTKFDGTYKGNLLPVSSYYYVIEFNDGVTKPLDGNLTIIY